jgi:hypothetical protein
VGVASGRDSGQKPVVLILARELAANVAAPMLVLDCKGTLVFFNEPAVALWGGAPGPPILAFEGMVLVLEPDEGELVSPQVSRR